MRRAEYRVFNIKNLFIFLRNKIWKQNKRGDIFNICVTLLQFDFEKILCKMQYIFFAMEILWKSRTPRKHIHKDQWNLHFRVAFCVFVVVDICIAIASAEIVVWNSIRINFVDKKMFFFLLVSSVKDSQNQQIKREKKKYPRWYHIATEKMFIESKTKEATKNGTFVRRLGKWLEKEVKNSEWHTYVKCISDYVWCVLSYFFFRFYSPFHVAGADCGTHIVCLCIVWCQIVCIAPLCVIARFEATTTKVQRK